MSRKGGGERGFREKCTGVCSAARELDALGRQPDDLSGPQLVNTASGSTALTMYWPASTISEILRSTTRLQSR
jgi:hypothetical protein